MLDTALLFRSAGELAALIRSGQVTSVQVVEAHLRQIQRWNSRISAVVTLCAESAREDAAAADRLSRSGQPLGPLHGVPITLKDAIRVAAMRSTFGGLPPYLWHHPRTDCELVARLRKAGAIILGRTNLPFMALDWQCRNPFFKECRNPWDLTRTPGGSSGGAAAALSAGFTPLELGSDLGGSIRYPAHCCGVLGLRTTDGLLPVDDFGPEGMSIPFQRLISFGPMARSISDLALMLDVLMGQVRAAASGPAGRALPERLRIAVTPELPGAEPNPDTRRLFSALCAGLRQDGHEVQDAAPDITMEDASRVWGTIAGYELWSSAPPLLKNRFSRALFQSYMLRYKLGEGPFTQYFGTGMLKSQREYEDALAEREKILQSVDGFFQRYDLWLLPVSMGEAIRSQRRGSPIQTEGESEGQVDRKTVPYSLYLGAYTIPTTTFGTPVLTIPIGFGTSGLPIGIQVHGARFSDRRLLDIAERFLSKHIALRIPPAFVPPA